MTPTVLETIRGGLVVSCQATDAMPLGTPGHLVALASQALMGGGRGLRMEGIATLALARCTFAPSVPIIGLWKQGDERGVYITPTLAAVGAVIETGVDMVALDATPRVRPDGSTVEAAVRLAHAASRLVLGDVATTEDGLHAQAAGVDAVATTLYGYVGMDRHPGQPDFQLIETLSRRLSIPVLAEGHIASPEDARRAMEAGAFAVIVGSAITRPEVLAARFAQVLSAWGPGVAAGDGA